MVTNQPMPITSTTGRTASGASSRATARGGSQEMNGPKNGIAWRTPAVNTVTAPYGSPNTTLTIAVIRPNVRPMISCVLRNPPKDRLTLACSMRAALPAPGGTSRRRKAPMSSRSIAM